MTKKDYIAIAESAKLIRNIQTDPENKLDLFLDDLCRKLLVDNPRFNREKFIKACGR